MKAVNQSIRGLLAVLVLLVGFNLTAVDAQTFPCEDAVSQLEVEYMGTQAVAGVQTVDIVVYREYRRGQLNEVVFAKEDVAKGEILDIDPQQWTSQYAPQTLTELRAQTYIAIFDPNVGTPIDETNPPANGSVSSLQSTYGLIDTPLRLTTDCQEAIVGQVFSIDREVNNVTEVYEVAILGHFDVNQTEWSIHLPEFPAQPWETKGNIVSSESYVLGSRNKADVKIVAQDKEYVRVTEKGQIGIGTTEAGILPEDIRGQFYGKSYPRK